LLDTLVQRFLGNTSRQVTAVLGACDNASRDGTSTKTTRDCTDDSWGCRAELNQREDGKSASSGSGEGVHVDKMDFGRREGLL
jgi:hypothetical protein